MNSVNSRPANPSRRPVPFGTLALAFVLFALVFALFAPSIRHGFIDFDDPLYIGGNRLVLDGFSLESVRRAFSSFSSSATMYMPLLWISYMADVSLFGASLGNPAPFHAVNVVLHAANAFLFFFLLLRLAPFFVRVHSGIRDPAPETLPAFLLALLWAVHPLRVESVAWITERKDVLSLFFALLAALAYLPRRGARSPCLANHLVSTALFAASLLVKPSLTPFPFALLLVDVFVLSRAFGSRLVLEKIPAFLLSAAAAFATVVGHRQSTVPLPLSLRVFHLPQTLAHYLRVSFFPRHLTLLAPDPPFGFWLALLDACLLSALFLLAFRLRRRLPAVALGVFWSFLFLLPVSGLVSIPVNAVADRFSYVPSLGLSIALLPVFALGKESPRLRRCALAAFSLLLAALAGISLRLLPFWRDSDTLYDRVRRFHPSSIAVATHDIHAAIASSGDFAAARDLAEKALERYPFNPRLTGVLATCIANLDGPEEAIRFLESRPTPAKQFQGEWAWLKAGFSLRLARPADALDQARFAASAIPGDDTLGLNILRLQAVAAFELGDMPLALSLARLSNPAATPDLSLELPYYIAQWMNYERADALGFFRRFVAAYPDRPDILANVAWILATASWSPAPPSETLDCATRALALVPDSPPPELLDTVAAAQANASDFPAAAATQQRAISLLPPSSPSLPDYQARLALYRRGLPFRRDIGIDW